MNHEIQRLSFKGKDVRERKAGADGRPFKLGVKDGFLILLVYYRIYITYTLDGGLLFNLGQSNIVDIQKIEGLIRQCLPISDEKCYKITKKRLLTSDEVEPYFPAFLSFMVGSTTEQ